MRKDKPMLTHSEIRRVYKEQHHIKHYGEFTLYEYVAFTPEMLRVLLNSVQMELDTPIDTLMRAFKRSTHITCVMTDGQLVGIARSMDDDCWSANIDFVVVHNDYQHRGIGKMMLGNLLQQMKSVPCISVSPNDSNVRGFYEK